MEQIGPYKVLGELGRGGMGAVYKALAPDGRTVAVKVLLRGRGATLVQRTRFEREARALAKVQHSSVVRLLDMGEERGAPYLVMEFHPEGALSDALRRTTLMASVAARVGLQVAAGLAAAHALGVLHRDVKPDNVLLSANGDAKLTDFGLAQDLDREGETQRLTKSGIFLGTPGYWAPEQAAGKLDRVGPATDVYGLGATLYAALTGRAPIVGENLLQVLSATMDETPPPIHSLRQDVPARLEAIVMRCLEKDPADRWPSASALGEALGESLTHPAAQSQRKALFPAIALSVVLLGVSGSLGAVLLRKRGESAEKQKTTSPEAALKTGDVSGPSSAGTESEPGAGLYEQARAAYQAGRDSEGTDLLRRAAEKGYLKAMSGLGVMLGAGRGVAKDEAEAVSWFRRAAEQGDVKAMTNLGVALGAGRGVAKDEAEAVSWFRRAAEQGDVNAMANLGLALESGRGVAKDAAEAVSWYRRAADLGGVRAMVNLGVMLESGRGVAKDEAEAVSWYRRAAERGQPQAMKNLGSMFESGRGVGRDDSEAASWYRRAAERGQVEAMYNLGVMLQSGRGAAKDETEAVSWYRRAAERGQPQAMKNLGVMLQSGRGVAKDEAEAVSWYRRAAEKGDVGAMYNLGVMLEGGRGVAKDETEAVSWYRRAAQRGQPQAMYTLGVMLEGGRGVAKDAAEAVRWYRRAAASDEPQVSAAALRELRRLGD